MKYQKENILHVLFFLLPILPSFFLTKNASFLTKIFFLKLRCLAKILEGKKYFLVELETVFKN